MLGYGFRHAIEYPLQIIKLARILYFHDDDLALVVKRLDVHPVELVILRQLITLALQ